MLNEMKSRLSFSVLKYVARRRYCANKNSEKVHFFPFIKNALAHFNNKTYACSRYIQNEHHNQLNV